MKDILNTVLSIFEGETLCNIYTDKKQDLNSYPCWDIIFRQMEMRKINLDD